MILERRKDGTFVFALHREEFFADAGKTFLAAIKSEIVPGDRRYDPDNYQWVIADRCLPVVRLLADSIGVTIDEDD